MATSYQFNKAITLTNSGQYFKIISSQSEHKINNSWPRFNLTNQRTVFTRGHELISRGNDLISSGHELKKYTHVPFGAPYIVNFLRSQYSQHSP